MEETKHKMAKWQKDVVERGEKAKEAKGTSTGKKEKDGKDLGP